MDLIGLYNYDQTLLDSLVLPEDLEDKRDTIKENILLETAERELVYPDAAFLKYAIGVWSAKQSPIWEELYKTTQYEYNPIWNVDGTVIEDRDLSGTDYRTDDHTTTRTHTDTITRTHNDTDTITHGKTDTTTHGLTDTITHGKTDTTTHGLTDTIDESVYGYNSTTKAPSAQKIDAQSGTTTVAESGTTTDAQSGTTTVAQSGTTTDAQSGTTTVAESGTTADAHTGTITDAHTGSITDADTGTINHDTSDSGTITTTRQGNIGVTSTQSLIQEQREVVKLNIIDVIIKDFADRFCLKVY